MAGLGNEAHRGIELLNHCKREDRADNASRVVGRQINRPRSLLEKEEEEEEY